MAINWVKARNEYINGNISYRALSKKYHVSVAQIAAHSKDEGWLEKRKAQQDKIRTKLEQNTAEAIADKEAARMVRISGLNDRLLDTIERAMNELNITVVHGRKQKKKSRKDKDGAVSEVVEVEENVDKAESIVDVARVRQLSAALRDIAEVSSMTKGYSAAGAEGTETDLVKALRDAYERDHNGI